MYVFSFGQFDCNSESCSSLKITNKDSFFDLINFIRFFDVLSGFVVLRWRDCDLINDKRTRRGLSFRKDSGLDLVNCSC